MGRFCCVLNCNQRGFGDNISYHEVPKNKELRTLWLKTIRRRDYLYKNVKSICVCSKHFEQNDFEAPTANGQRYLKKKVVPSKFTWKFERPNENVVPSQVADLQEHKPLDDPVTEQVEKNLQSLEDSIENLPNGVVGATVTEAEPGTASIEEIKRENILLNNEIMSLKKQVNELKIVLHIKSLKLFQTEKRLEEELKSVQKLENQIKKLTPSLENIKNDDEAVAFYTGLPNYKKVMQLYEFLDPGIDGENIIYWKGSASTNNSNAASPGLRCTKISTVDQFFMVLMRLRLGLFVRDLADRFKISKALVSNICNTWINYMYLQLSQISIWPTREQVDASMPEKFRESYPTTRVILDASEIKCEVPSSLVLQSGTYSNYKSCNTYKGLIGISPNAFVTFVSSLYTGSISDKELTQRSGFCELDFEENDSVMADKGFLIEDMLKEKKVLLNIPPFIGPRDQFEKHELEETQKIAALRIHVERRIQRIKGWHIFDRPIPISLSPVVNQLFTVAAILTNFQKTIIKKKLRNQNDSNSENENSFELDDSLEWPINA